MAEIEHASRPRSTPEEKRSMDLPQHGTDEESPSRIEEGEKGGLFLSEEAAVAQVKACPDDATPIYLTWRTNDPTNPRNWPVRLRINPVTLGDLTFCSTAMAEMVDYLLCELLELFDVSD